MKTRKVTSVLAVLTVCFCIGSTGLQAADGTWTNLAGGTWSTGGNWSGGTVADGSSFTARFDTLNIAAGSTTVNLDSARTIGTVVFGDTDTSTAGNWILANNSTPANILTLGGAATITVNAMSSVNNTGSNVTISAIIDGTNGLTKNGTGTNTTGTNNTVGTGTLTLSGANTYTGATNIDSGTIRATNASAFGGVAGGKLATNVVNVATGARLILSNVSIANTVNLNGVNALSVSGGNGTLSGTVNLQSNSSAYVHNGGNYVLTLSGTVNLASNVFTINTTGNLNGANITGAVTGGSGSGITKNGNGPLTISGDGSGYSGTTTHTSGELVVGSSNALGTGTLALNMNNNALGTVRSNSATDRSIAAAVTIGNGIAARYAFGSAATGSLTFTNTTDISITSTKLFEVNQTGPGTSTQFDAGFVGSGGITKQTGTGTLILNGANTYTGGTTINAGTLQLGNGGTTGTLSTSSTITNNGNFAVNRSDAVVQGTDFSGGAISGTGTFTQAGTGSTTLTAANTYTGATMVNAGTLLVNGSLAAGSAVSVASGASLGGDGTINGAVTVNGSITPGNSIGTLTVNNDVTWNGMPGEDWNFELGVVSGSSDLLLLTGAGNDFLKGTGSDFRFDFVNTGVAGTFVLVDWDDAAATTFDLGDFSYTGLGGGLTGSFAFNGSQLEFTAVPEPSTYALLGLGLGVLVWLRRKQKVA